MKMGNFGSRQDALQGKVVLLTGASSGIGESLAKVLYGMGCKLILVSRRQAELERVRDELVKSKVKGETYVPTVFTLDVGDLEAINQKTGKLLAVHGHIDILINNAGITHRGTSLETGVEVDEKLMRINYLGPIALTKGLAKSMIERKSGHIVFVSSVMGKIAVPLRSAYTASKHAMQAQADSLRAEVAEHGIKVLVVSPGYVKTNLPLNAMTGSGEKFGKMDENTESGYEADDVAEDIVRSIVKGCKDRVIAPLIPRIAISLRSWWPTLFFWIMEKRARKEMIQN